VKRPSAPKHLALPTRRWWTSVVESWHLEEHHVRLLTLAAEAWDRAQQARVLVDAEGITVLDRYGVAKCHPAVAVERDSRVVFARLLRELDLDGEPTPESRVPRIGGRLANPNQRPTVRRRVG
jgi:phage terminase small subunit